MALLRLNKYEGEHKKAYQTIKRSLKKYIVLMGMDRWTIIVSWGKIADGYGAEASLTDWAYYKVKFKFDLKTMNEDIASIDEYVRHELFHAMLSPLTQTARALLKGESGPRLALYNLEERVATDLENMPLWGKLK